MSLLAQIPCKAVGPMYIGRAIPGHMYKNPVRLSIKPGVTVQIPQFLRLAVKLHRHHYR